MLLFLTLNLSAQRIKDELYIGATIGLKEQSCIRLQYERYYKYVHQEYCTQVDIKGDFYVQAKMGFGFNTKKWRGYIYMPFLNFNISEKGYNTPIGFEIFYMKSRKASPFVPCLSFNVDIYKNEIVPMLRIKYRLLK